MQFDLSTVGISSTMLVGEEGDTGADNPDDIMYNPNFFLDVDVYSSSYASGSSWAQYSTGYSDNWQILSPDSLSFYGAAYCAPSGLTWGNGVGPNYASLESQPSSYMVWKDQGSCFASGQKIT